jgi:tetratricopeptide (TPR) repeat protein
MRNEEAQLPGLAASLREFLGRGGDWIILDTGSIDNSVKIAKSLGARVFEAGEKFIFAINEDTANKINERFIIPPEEPIIKAGDKLFDYSSARNEAASYALNDMCQMPDVDEKFTKCDIDYINDVIRQGYTQIEFSFIFAHLPNGKPAVQFRQSKSYNRKIMKWVGYVHEVLQGDAKRIYIPPDKLLLEHFQAPQAHRSRYMAGLALDCWQHPDNDRNSHYLARELFWSGRYHSAIKEFTRHVAMNRWIQERGESMIFIGDAHLALGDEEKAIEAWHKAIQIDDTRRAAWMHLADLYCKKNNPQRVICYCTAALEIPPNDCYMNLSAHYTFEPHERLYWAYNALGNKEKAKEHWKKAFDYWPDNPKFLADKQYYDPASEEEILPKLAILLPTLGRPEGLERCLESIRKSFYPKDLITVYTDDDAEASVPVKVNRLAKAHLDVDAYVYAANDVVFETFSLRDAARASKEHGLVAFNSGDLYPDQGNICEHFIITKNLVDKLGEIFCERFHHVGCDNLLWAKASKLGQAYRCEAAIIKHHHFAKGEPMDAVYERGWSQVEQDRAILKEELAKLEDPNRVEVITNIPKRIFTIFLNDYDGMPSVAKRCFPTHQLPGYEHRFITMKNAYLEAPYIQQALASNNKTKWVKIADYLRIWYLLTEGGIYVDSDMEILPGKNFDQFLHYRMFAGKEHNGWISNALMGAEKGYPFLSAWLTYMEKNFRGDDGKVYEAAMEPMTKNYWPGGSVFSYNNLADVMDQKPGAAKTLYQEPPNPGWYREGFIVYPPEYFNNFDPRTWKHVVSPETIAIHHFTNAWLERRQQRPCCDWQSDWETWRERGS